MNLTTVNVAISVQQLIGAPLPGGSVRFELTRADINGALVLPKAVTVALPADGSTATARLWPNALGTQGSQTKVTVLDQAGVEQFSGLATIPPTDCNLHDVMNLQAPPVLSDAQAAALTAQAAAAAAQAAQAAAQQAAGDAPAVHADRLASDASAASAAHIYAGTYASDPTARPDGSAVQAGDLYFTTAGVAKSYASGVWAQVPGASAADLASSTDPTKGSSLVGFDGSTVANTLSNVGGKALRKISDKLYKISSSNTVEQLKLLTFGDSMAPLKWAFVKSWLRERFYQTGAFGYFDTAYEVAGGAAQVLTAYSYWPSGVIYTVPAAGSLTQYGEQGPFSCDKITLFYVKESGAGTFKVQSHDGTRWVDEAGFTNVDASNATTVAGVITITKSAPGNYMARVVGLTGTVRVIGFAFRNTKQRGVDFYQISQGGISLTSANTSSQSILNTVLADLAPDMAFFEMKETDATQFAIDLPAHQARLDAANAMPWVYVGSPPVSVNDALQVTNNRLTRSHAAAYGHTYFDSYTPIGSYANLAALGWQNDGTHPTDACSEFLADLMMQFLGFFRMLRSLPTLRSYRDRLVFSDALDKPLGSTATIGNGGVVLGTGDYTVGGFVMLDEGAGGDLFGGNVGCLRVNFSAGGAVNVSKTGVTQGPASLRSVQARRWTWVVVSRIAGTVRFYFDALPAGSGADALDYSTAVTMVASNNSGTPPHMLVREPFIMNRGLTQGEIHRLYQGWFDVADFGTDVNSAVASGSLVVGKLYEVRGTGSITHNAVTYALGERFIAAATTFTVASGAPTAVRLGLAFAAGQLTASGLWSDVSGNSRHVASSAVMALGGSSRPALSGTATLVNGVVTVACPQVQVTSVIRLIRQQFNASTALGQLRLGTITGGTSFQIAASQAAAPATLEAGDQSSVYWELV